MPLNGTQILELLIPLLDGQTLLNVRQLSSHFKNRIDKYLENEKNFVAGGTTSMLKKYIEFDAQKGVKYLTPEERESAKLTISNGLFYTGAKLFTSGIPTANSPSAQRVHLFAISRGGDFYVYSKLPNIHHSTMLSGEDVICAGFIEVKNGKLTYISNSSGHYQPSIVAVLQTINLLVAANVKPDTYAIGYERPQANRPKDYGSAKVFIDQTPVPLQMLSQRLAPAILKK